MNRSSFAALGATTAAIVAGSMTAEQASAATTKRRLGWLRPQ
jgi:hypothetical protein